MTDTPPTTDPDLDGVDLDLEHPDGIAEADETPDLDLPDDEGGVEA